LAASLIKLKEQIQDAKTFICLSIQKENEGILVIYKLYCLVLGVCVNVKSE
jgi:hypothetical protein